MNAFGLFSAAGLDSNGTFSEKYAPGKVNYFMTTRFYVSIIPFGLYTRGLYTRYYSKANVFLKLLWLSRNSRGKLSRENENDGTNASRKLKKRYRLLSAA